MPCFWPLDRAGYWRQQEREGKNVQNYRYGSRTGEIGTGKWTLAERVADIGMLVVYRSSKPVIDPDSY